MRRIEFFIIALIVAVGCGGTSASPAPTDAAGHDASPADTVVPPDVPLALDAPLLDAPVPPDVSLDVVDASEASTPDAPAAPDTSACPTGQTRCGDACLDLQTDAAHCGSCTSSCRTLPGVNPATITCDRGSCTVHDHCADSFADCDGIAANGCETDLSRATSCGACGTVCSGTTATCAMVMGDGGLATRACTNGCTPMTPTRCDATCTNTQTDPTNCGGCNLRCTLPNATPSCVGGTCGIASCTAGFGDCDRNASNGCELNLSSPTNCGICGGMCAVPNATAGCSLGACTIASCLPGFGDCNGDAADGCEVDVRANVASCGTCGHVCALANATPVCSAGTCAIASCTTGFGNCDGNPANGCELPLSSSTNCGMCGRSCPTPSGPHTVARCAASGGSFTCGLICESGYLDCDSNLTNGCEATGSCTIDRELFYDGFESGGGRWSMDPPWRVTNAGFYMPCGGTLEMFGERTVFDGCVLSGNVTLISPIDISRATTLTLTHQSRSFLGASGAFTISVSTDGGHTWNTVGSPGTATCGLQSIDLSASVGRSTLLLRFSYSSGACETNFWRLDEVRVRALVRNY